MKKLLAALLCALLLCGNAWAEGDFAVFQDQVSVALDTEYVNLGDVKAESLKALESFLKKLPNLKKVDMFSTPVNASQIAELEKLFPQVEFGWTMTIPCKNPLHPERKYHSIRTDATAFSTLHNNQCTEHTSQEFEILKYCKKLLALDIGHNAVDSLEFLRYLPKLRVLIIGRNYVKDLSPLAACPDLEYLEAFTNEIVSVEPLLACTHMIDLNIPNNRIQDPLLLKQMTWLKRLWAFNYAWRDPEINYAPWEIRKEITQALPNCKVDWTQSGTGGWRDHPHYPVIVQMFNSGEYIPFADSWPFG